MRAILGVVLVASLTFLGTMFDNFFAFASQLVMTERRRFRRVSIAQALGVATIVAMAGALGTLLAPIPLRWIGLLCVAPFAFALHAWRHRQAPREQFRRGAITTFILTLSLGGDNLAVWTPLLRANGLAHGLVSAVTIMLWDLLFLVVARAIAVHPRVVAWGTKRAVQVLPFLYVVLGVTILLECRTVSFH